MKVLAPVVALGIGLFFLGWLLVTAVRLLGGVLGIGMRRLSSTQRATLEKYFLFYGTLSPDHQKRFRKVMAAFLNDKDWQGVGIEVAEEMKVMISASATQLLFGLPDLTLMHFQRILVYPDAYRNRRDGRFHQGEVSPAAGVIRISWPHFLEGYARPADAHNVALHEMAHALWFEEIIPNAEDDLFDDRVMARWKELAEEEIHRIRKGRGELFRSYAGSNQEEFFAVAVEYFFERPAEFKEELPELYATLEQLLRQDPARTDGQKPAVVSSHARPG